MSNYTTRSQAGYPSWIKPSVLLPLSQLLQASLPQLLFQAVTLFREGKLRKPLDKTHDSKGRSSRSVSASAVPHGGQSSQRSGVGTDSDAITSFNDTSTPSEKTSNRSHLTSRNDRSSSDPDLSLLLRREAQQTFEKNKNFLDPAIMTRDSNSSRSPNTSGSKDYSKQDRSSYYDEGGGLGYYYANGCYYPYPVVCVGVYPQLVPTNGSPTEQFADEQRPRKSLQTLSQQSKPFVPRREEVKKLDPSAPAYEQKKKPRVLKPDEVPVHVKEEKRDNGKPKPVRRPLGNAAGNTIRQIINRNKLKTRAKDEPEQRDLSPPRRAKSRDTANTHFVKEPWDAVEDSDIQSDVYAQDEAVARAKKEVKKQRLHKKRSRRPAAQNLLAFNASKRTGESALSTISGVEAKRQTGHKRTNVRDRSLEAKDRVCVTNGGKEWKREITREGRRGKLAFVPRGKRREFEEDRNPVAGRKLSVDLSKRVVRQPTPDHKASIGSEFS